MREIRYFGLNQWAEMKDFLFELRERIGTTNISVNWDSFTTLVKVSWDEELIDLENK